MSSSILKILGPLVLAATAGQSGAEGIPGVSFTIRPDTAVSSDTATLCRVTATNHTGRTLDARKISFEARAREHGRIAARERGRFGGPLEDGASVETVIAFTGVFSDFEVGPARGAGPASGRSNRGKRGAAARSKKAKKRR